jgi:hypothetical protein
MIERRDGIGAQHLQRDATPEPRIERAVDAPHPLFAEDRLERVSVDGLPRLDHGAKSTSVGGGRSVALGSRVDRT